jgi:hypothetical protein
MERNSVRDYTESGITSFLNILLWSRARPNRRITANRVLSYIAISRGFHHRCHSSSSSSSCSSNLTPSHGTHSSCFSSTDLPTHSSCSHYIKIWPRDVWLKEKLQSTLVRSLFYLPASAKQLQFHFLNRIPFLNYNNVPSQRSPPVLSLRSVQPNYPCRLSSSH